MVWLSCFRTAEAVSYMFMKATLIPKFIAACAQFHCTCQSQVLDCTLGKPLPQSQEAMWIARLVIWGFPKIRGTILGVPIMRIIVFWGLYWGPLILGNYHIGLESKLTSRVLGMHRSLWGFSNACRWLTEGSWGT